MDKLTNKELEVLLEAIEKWEEVDGGIGRMMAGAMMRKMAEDDPEANEKIDKMEKERELKEKKEMHRRKRIATSIKSKIYDIIESRGVEELGNDRNTE